VRHRSTFALLVTAVLVLGATPAGAARRSLASSRRFAGGTTAASVTDPDDVDTPLDIATASVGGDSSTVTFTLQTYEPFADTDVDGVAFPLDVNGNGSADYMAVAGYDPDAGVLRAAIVALPSFTPAPASVTRPAALDDTLTISASRGAIGGVSSFEWFATTLRDLDGDGEPDEGEIDVAPDGAEFRMAAFTARVFGDDRVMTAIEVSRQGFEDGTADAVVIARSDTFPDALAGTPLAIAKGGPLLLNPPGAIDPRVRDEVRRVLPPGGTVYVLGGAHGISAVAPTLLEYDGYRVVRLAGADRFETSVLVAEQGIGPTRTAFLTTGLDFPDALAAGAAAGVRHGVVLLTAGSTVPPRVASYLEARPGMTRYAVGGPAAAADPRAIPIVGSDRYETAARVAQTFFTDPLVVGIASGERFPDALAGGASVGLAGGPLLLSPADRLAPATDTYLRLNRDSIALAVLFGGPQALSGAVEAGVQDALA
jgi:putative cell wall-binding protein